MCPSTEALEPDRGRNGQFPASLVDRFLACTHAAMTGDIHCVLRFNGRIDAERLATAVDLLSQADPVLGSCLIPQGRGLAWRRYDGKTLAAAVREVDRANADRAVFEFLGRASDPFEEPQLQTLLVRESVDTLCVKLTHIAGDGATLMQTAYRIAEFYRRLGADPAARTPTRPPDRSVVPASRQLGFHRLGPMLKLVHSLRKNPLVPGPWLFPAPAVGASRPEVALHRISIDRGRALARYARRQVATSNLALLAVYYRALCAVVPRVAGRSVVMPTTMNLRPYLQDASVLPDSCNFSGAIRFTFPPGDPPPLDELVAALKVQMQARKTEFTGHGSLPLFLDANPLLRVIVGRVSHAAMTRRVQQRVLDAQQRGNTGIAAMTNAGGIDAGQLRFGDVELADVYGAAGTLRIPGVIPLVATSFRDGWTLAVGFLSDMLDRPTLERVFRQIDAELPS